MQTQTEAENRSASMPSLDDDALLNSAQVKARCGNVTNMCIWRWMRDDRVQFPKPIQINKRNYWRLGDVRAWRERHANKAAA